MSKPITKKVFSMYVKLLIVYGSVDFIAKDIYKMMDTESRSLRHRMINDLYSNGWIAARLDPVYPSKRYYKCRGINTIISEMELD